MDSKNFRVIFALREINLDESRIKDPHQFRISIDGQSKTSEIPFKEGLVFDLNILNVNSKIELSLENSKGHLVAFGDLTVPEDVHRTQESELKATLTMSTVDQEVSPIVASVLLVFINKGLLREKGRTSTTTSIGSASPHKNVKSKVNIPLSGQYSPTRSGSPRKSGTPNRGNSPVKARADKEKEHFDAYLQKLVQKHTGEVMNIVKDHKDIGDTIALNKRAGNLIDPSSGGSVLVERTEIRTESSPHKISITWDEVGSPTIKKGDEEIEITAESLKQRYSAKAELSGTELNRSTSLTNGSPSKKKTLEYMTTNVDSEAERSWESAQIEYLKNVILALDAKNKEVDALKQENELLKDQMQKSEEGQHELRQSIEETTKELKQENDVSQKQVQNLIDERSILADKIRDLNSKLEDATNAHKRSEQQKNRLENDLQDYNQEVKRRVEVQNHINLVNAKVIENEKHCQDQVNGALKRFDEAGKHVDQAKKNFESLTKENERLSNELADTVRRLNQEKRLNHELNNEVSLLNQKLQHALGVQDLVDTLRGQQQELLGQLQESQQYSNTLTKAVEDLRNQLNSRNKQIEAQDKAHAEEVSKLNKKINQQDEKINTLNVELNTLVKTLSEYKSKISTLEQFLCNKEDLNRQLDQLKQRLAKAIQDRDQANDSVKKLAISSQSAHDAVLELNRTIRDLQIIIRERDEYIINLKRVITEIREGNPLYVPIKEDATDNALADYINSLNDPGKLKVLFVREGEGVYQFGSKKVYVKSEGDKILIRVGGGFLTIEDFLEQNVPTELNKLASKDPVKMLNNNIQLHKALAGRVVNQIQKTTTTAYSYKPVINRTDSRNSPA